MQRLYNILIPLYFSYIRVAKPNPTLIVAMTPKEIQLVFKELDELKDSSKFLEAKEVAYGLLEQKELYEDSVTLAKVYNYAGNINRNLSDFTKALEFFEKAILIEKQNQNLDGIATNYSNIAVVYGSLSDFPKSLHFFEDALNIYEEIGDKARIAAVLGNLGIVYRSLSDYSKSLEYYGKAIKIEEECGNNNGIAKNLGNIGNVYNSLADYPKAIEYYEMANKIKEEINIKEGMESNLGNLGSVYTYLSDYPKALEYYGKALKINEEIGSDYGKAIILGNIGVVYKELSDFQKALEYHEKSLFINEEIGYKVGMAINLGNIGIVFSNLSDFPKALEYLQKAYSLSQEIGAKKTSLDLLQELSKVYEEQNEIELAFSYFKQSIALKEEIQSEESTQNAQLFDQRRKIEEDEKARQLKLARFQEQEKILHNILPINIADRILQHETFIADHFESVSVLFMDLVGFTKLSSTISPKQLVSILDAIFTLADEVLDQFGLEKIKTIGDGYLAVANVTSPLVEHQKATALAALQLLETMKNFTVTMPTDLGDTNWIKDMNDIEIRIGIHTGEVVAGIIGKNKYTYDLWGDAVNVASRMESQSEAGRIHISEAFAKSIDSYAEFSLIPRGEIFVKGKGTMNTFWLEKRK